MFADEQPPRVPAAVTADPNNIFAAPTVAEPAPHSRQHYEMILPHHGRQILYLGIAGSGAALFGAVVLAPILWLLLTSAAELTLIVNTAAIGISLTAIVMARLDLKAMDAGAMRDDGRNSVILGRRLGWLGFGVGCCSWLGIAYWLLAVLFADV